jgi:hypothetical protein
MSYGKTQAGQLAFKERSPLLSARQRAAFILFDGVKSLNQVLVATAGLGITSVDIEHMVRHGLLQDMAPASAAPLPSQLLPVASSPSLAPATTGDDGTHAAQARFSEAWPLATQLTATLGLRGFRLNLAVEAAGGFDDLLALFPKIQAAAGVEKSQTLERVLKG